MTLVSSQSVEGDRVAQKIRTGRPRPEATVQRVVWTGVFEDIPAKWRATGHFHLNDNDELVINTNHVPKICEVGEYIVRGLAKEFYPLPAALYHAKYEDVD